ncbi:hypothetical protein SDRG_17133 [Saprolegnia diclina VS20]|uniref:Non-structural maintenance of chromosomes element 1 homolog n=1 Tax=Saprolegnia diclina (strain VS20) TaxID=1156394 RepID=T0PVF8_SAPDV|nr:hypothetical protein SDRG_17133 [Saprolegnia diclina VS20]EQC24985.1 hypothetical protein SDRG_17133 [Saprolegnia diclina VS20]|eukprot:XP_008621590.1 hypothetical protein SDRG_17133 [Saprolegnia diclina VS20]
MATEQKILQVFMAHGSISESELKTLCDQICGQDFSTKQLGDLTTHIATLIRPYSLDIKRAMYDDGEMYYGIINTSNDDLTKLSNTFKPWEIVLFRKAIEAIVESDDGELDTRDFCNLREGNSLQEVKTLFQRLYMEKWFAPSLFNNDQATLGPRVFLELVVFLRELGIQQCVICSSDVLQSVRCPTASCTTRVHESCLAKYERAGRAFKCGPCKKAIR